MKKYFILMMLAALASQCNAQVDSTAARLQRLEIAIIHMQDNLDRAHREFRTGVNCAVAGSVFLGAGIIIHNTAEAGANIDQGPKDVMLIAGSASLLVGAFFMIDSHKYIGRAGRWQFTGTGISYSLNAN